MQLASAVLSRAHPITGGGQLAQLRYDQYRLLLARRQSANSSIMALLAGSKLALNTLALSRGSKHPLSEIYPEVQHIERFSLRTDVASSLLADADQHLAIMAVPYVLALHEDYMAHCCEMLVAEGQLSRRKVNDMSAKTMHDVFAVGASAAFDVDDLALFQVLRSIRNSFIHSGGVVGAELEAAVRSLPPSAIPRWARIAREQMPSFTVGDPISLGHQHIIATLAVTSTLMKEANLALEACVPRASWADRALSDAQAEGQASRGNPNQRRRSLRTFVNRYYSNLKLSDDELIDAGKRIGLRLKE